jgi:hypothetical protein
MRTYSLYVEDDRSSVPTLLFVTANDDTALRRIAREELSGPHHHAVEAREGDRVVFRLPAPEDNDLSRVRRP